MNHETYLREPTHSTRDDLHGCLQEPGMHKEADTLESAIVSQDAWNGFEGDPA